MEIGRVKMLVGIERVWMEDRVDGIDGVVGGYRRGWKCGWRRGMCIEKEDVVGGRRRSDEGRRMCLKMEFQAGCPTSVYGRDRTDGERERRNNRPAGKVEGWNVQREGESEGVYR